MSIRRLPRLGGRIALPALLAPFALAAALIAQAPRPAPAPETVPLPQISESDTREWLTYLSSDLLEGREVFTEGYGLAASYVAEHLRQWGLTPMGTLGSYFQVVRECTYRVTQKSTVTVEVGGETRTFHQGEHIAFSTPVGAPQTLTFDGVELSGYGIVLPGGKPSSEDFGGRSMAGKLVMFLPGMPRRADAGQLARAPSDDRAAAILQFLGAAGAMSYGAVNPARPSTGSDADTPGELTTTK